MDVTVDLNRGTAVVAQPHTTGVSWGAIIAGAVAGAALALLLTALGTGLGLASVSPWSNSNPSAATFSIGAAIWLTISQLLAAAVGGYLAGRLRTRWNNVHTDEVYFRDTAHGLVAWAVATVIGFGVLASAATSFLGRSAEVTAIASTGPDRESASSSYFIDTLFRSTKPEIVVTRPLPTAEAARILAVSLKNDGISPADETYLAGLVASRTDLTPTEAKRRIDDVLVDMKDAANTTRKVAATFAIWAALSLLVGAFTASLAATFGGRLRDRI